MMAAGDDGSLGMMAARNAAGRRDKTGGSPLVPQEQRDTSDHGCWHNWCQRGIPPPSILRGIPPSQGHTCRPSLLQTPLTVFVGAMVTTGGVLGTLCPPGGTMMGPMGPRLGVLAGELWLVAGEETGDDSLLIEEPEIKFKIKIKGGKAANELNPPSK